LLSDCSPVIYPGWASGSRTFHCSGGSVPPGAPFLGRVRPEKYIPAYRGFFRMLRTRLRVAS
jgi:hypothetical protein